MTYYYRLGDLPHKRHTQFRKSDGSLHHEEVMGIHGFAGIQSILYHLYPPTRVQRMEVLRRDHVEYEEQGPLRHRHLRTEGTPAGGDAVAAPPCFRGSVRKGAAGRRVWPGPSCS